MYNAGMTIPNMNMAMPVSSTTISGMLPAMQTGSNLSPLTHDIYNPRPTCNNDPLARQQRIQSFLGFPWQASAYRQLFQQQQAINGNLMAQLQGALACGSCGNNGLSGGMMPGMNNQFALTQPGATSPFALATPMTGLNGMQGVMGTQGLQGLSGNTGYNPALVNNGFSSNGLTYTPLNNTGLSSFGTNTTRPISNTVNTSNSTDTAVLLGQLLGQLLGGQMNVSATTPSNNNPYISNTNPYGAL